MLKIVKSYKRTTTPEKNRRRIRFWNITIWNQQDKDDKLKLLLDNNNSDVGDIVSLQELFNYTCIQSIIYRDFNNKKIFGPWSFTQL